MSAVAGLNPPQAGEPGRDPLPGLDRRRIAAWYAAFAGYAALLGWLLAETRDGSVLGLAERLTSSIQTCWPFIVALTRRPRPGPASGGSGGAKDAATARAGARGRGQDR